MSIHLNHNISSVRRALSTRIAPKCFFFKSMHTSTARNTKGITSGIDLVSGEEDPLAEDPDHKNIFGPCPIVTLYMVKKFMYDAMKIRFVKERDKYTKHTGRSKKDIQDVRKRRDCEPNIKVVGSELLRNNAAKRDYFLVDGHKPHVCYYRLELLRQRLAYLKHVGMSEAEKLAHLREYPPALVFSLTNPTVHGKLVYLRGMVKQSEKKLMNIFYPVSRLLAVDTWLIRERLGEVGEELKLHNPGVLELLFDNMPVFFMQAGVHAHLHQVLHLHLRSLPHFYNVMEQTMPLLPPVCKSTTQLGISTQKHLRRSAPTADLVKLPTYMKNEFLDLSYLGFDGKETPECLSSFLMRADSEEGREHVEDVELMREDKRLANQGVVQRGKRPLKNMGQLALPNYRAGNSNKGFSVRPRPSHWNDPWKYESRRKVLKAPHADGKVMFLPKVAEVDESSN